MLQTSCGKFSFFSPPFFFPFSPIYILNTSYYFDKLHLFPEWVSSHFLTGAFTVYVSLYVAFMSLSSIRFALVLRALEEGEGDGDGDGCVGGILRGGLGKWVEG